MFLIAILLIIASALMLFVFITLAFLTIDVFLDLPFVGARCAHVDTIMKLANIKKGETIIDLGSGDGRLLFAAARKGAKAIGYEINPFLIILTKIHSSLKGVEENIKVRKENLWKADLKIADVIFVYAKRNTMQKFEDFVYKNAKKGTRIVVNTNPFPSKKALNSENNIFLYII
jgi:cyclopropane fatty-acyl-phospholipid synthase-like methyltransferase